MFIQLNLQYLTFIKFELLGTLSPVTLFGPHKSSDEFLCTTHSLEYLVSEEIEA